MALDKVSLLCKFWDFTIFVCGQIDSRLFRRKSSHSTSILTSFNMKDIIIC